MLNREKRARRVSFRRESLGQKCHLTLSRIRSSLWRIVERMIQNLLLIRVNQNGGDPAAFFNDHHPFL